VNKQVASKILDGVRNYSQSAYTSIGPSGLAYVIIADVGHMLIAENIPGVTLVTCTSSPTYVSNHVPTCEGRE